MSTRRYFTQQERDFIAANYATMSRTELGRALDRPETSIKLYVQRAGLKKGGASASHFQKGNKPWNAGQKGWVVAGLIPHRFRPGQVPHNATGYYDGMIVIRQNKSEPPYKYYRISKGKWVLSHRHKWEQMHGPIPAGHLLKCQSADTLNDNPDNWRLVTRRQLAIENKIWLENKASNTLTASYLASTLTKGRPELKEAVLAIPELLEVQRLKITLNRTIKDELGNAA